MRWFLGVLAFWAILLLGTTPRARAEELEAAFTELPPFSQTDESGQVIGIAVERLKKVLAAAGYDVHVAIYPMRRAVDLVSEGAVQVAVAPHSEAREKVFLFSHDRLIDVRLSIYWLDGARIPSSAADLGDQTVIALMGQDITIDQLRHAAPQVDFLTASTHDVAVAMLQKGRAPYLLDYDGPVQVSIARLGVTGIHRLGVSSNPGYIVVSRRAPDAERILARIEAAMKVLRASGDLG